MATAADTREDTRARLTIAAYIDLNPVRAGLVKDPKEECLEKVFQKHRPEASERVQCHPQDRRAEDASRRLERSLHAPALLGACVQEP